MTEDVSHRRPMSCRDHPWAPETNTHCLANEPGAEGPEGSEQCNAPVDTVGDLFCRRHREKFDRLEADALPAILERNEALRDQFIADLAAGDLVSPPSVRAGPSASACSGAPFSRMLHPCSLAPSSMPFSDAPESAKPARAGLPFPGSPVRPSILSAHNQWRADMELADAAVEKWCSARDEQNSISSSQGVSARDSASDSPTPRSPGGYPSGRHAMLKVLVDGLIDSIWVLADKDPRTSADLHERAIAQLQEEEATDRRAAIRKAREDGS